MTTRTPLSEVLCTSFKEELANFSVLCCMCCVYLREGEEGKGEERRGRREERLGRRNERRCASVNTAFIDTANVRQSCAWSQKSVRMGVAPAVLRPRLCEGLEGL